MSNLIQVPSRDQVNEKSQGIFDQLKSNLGMVPNLYATIGYSSDALSNFLQYDAKAGGSSFNAKELEAIKLAVSEVNGCAYCLAAHTAIAQGKGFTKEETIDLREGTIQDSKLKSIAQLAANIAENRGHADELAIVNFLNEGHDEKALIDLIAAVTSITFTNYVHGATKVAVDFPAAPALVA